MRWTAVLVVVALVVACSPPADPETATQAAIPRPTVSASPSPSPTAGPSRDADPVATESATPFPEAAGVPLVVATHLTLPPVDLTSTQLNALLAGQPPDWTLPGSGGSPRVVVAPGLSVPPGAVVAASAGAALQEVRADPATVALVPGSAMDPTVRAARVDGVDPLRSPDEYRVSVPGLGPEAVVTVAIGGDVMMDRRVGQRLVSTGDFAEPFRSIAPRLAAADVAMVNLESTLAELGPPTQGVESFVADPRIREGLTLAGIDVVGLANNHTGDYGPPSLLRTIDLLREGGFATFGAGPDLTRADRPAVLLRDGVSVAFVGFNAIGETPAAGPGVPGASSLAMPPRTGPLDQARLTQLTEQVRELSARVDVLIVVPHWGTQYTADPVPEQSQVGQALLAAGADVVVGGHPHWVQALEQSPDGRLLVHSLGNLVFDMDFSVETMEGVVAELVIWDDHVVAVDLVPYEIGPDWVPRWVDPQGRGMPILQRIWQASSQPFASPS